MNFHFHAFQDDIFQAPSIDSEDKSDLSERISLFDPTTSISLYSMNNFLDNNNTIEEIYKLNQYYEIINKSDYAVLFEVTSDSLQRNFLTFDQFKEIVVPSNDQSQEILKIKNILNKLENKGIFSEFLFQYIQRYQVYLSEFQAVYKSVCTLDYFKGFCTHMFQSFENKIELDSPNLINIFIDSSQQENRLVKKSISFISEYVGINSSEKERAFLMKIYTMQIELLEKNLLKSQRLIPCLDKNLIENQYGKLKKILSKETMNPSEALISMFPESEEMFKEKLEQIVIQKINKFTPSKISVSDQYLSLFLRQYLILKRETQLLWINYLYTHVCLMYTYNFHLKSIKKELKLSLLYYYIIIYNNDNEIFKSRVASMILRIHELQVEKYNQYKKIYLYLFSNKMKKYYK